MTKLATIKYLEEDNTIVIIDQTKLPNELVYKTLQTDEDVWLAINKLEVRGAPLIGITAAYGLAMVEKNNTALAHSLYLNHISDTKEYLISARPTAVNLEIALDTIMQNLDLSATNEAIANQLINNALEFHKADIAISEGIAFYGNQLLSENNTIVTYCNAGLLATGNTLGTALAPVYAAVESGKKVHVYACETRPVLQGARLTTFELVNAGIPTTLITDNMIGWLLSTKHIDAIFVGCDRVAKNGDFANKIGTHTLAVLAKEYHVPFYVCLPSTTIDFNAKSKDDIIIVFRDGEEVRSMWYQTPMVDARVDIENPAFDCTPASFVTGYITEKGILLPPFNEEQFK